MSRQSIIVILRVVAESRKLLRLGNRKQAFVYILASQRNGTFYTGVTSNLVQRIYQHKSKAHAKGFTAKYAVDKLVWYEAGEDMAAAIALEKKIKNRNRAWKLALIEKITLLGKT
jgi:putative endonuclease